MLGDSVGRDIFTLASCLLHARHGLTEADSFGRIWNRHMQIGVMARPICNHRLRTFAAIARAQMLSAPQLHAFARMSTCLLLTCASSAHALYTRYFYVRFCAHPYAGASSEATTLTASSPRGAASTPPCGCAALTLDTGTHDVHCLCAPLRRLRAACTLRVLPRRQSPRPSTQCPAAV